MLQEKQMIAALPANPYHCPKCGRGLIEHDFPIAIFADNGIHFTDAETHFFCSVCNTDWQPHQIPDHPLYEPAEYDPTECPNCHEHARREIDIIPQKEYDIYDYLCTKCGKVWSIRKRHDD